MLNAQAFSIRPGEWRWVLAWSLIIVTLVNLPYGYGSWLSTPAQQFGGFIIGLEDGNSYLAKMQEGFAGYWLFYLAYTPEAHSGALFFAFYLLLGSLARFLQLEPLAVMQVARPLMAGFGLFSFYYFAAYFTADIFIRRLAFALFGLTAGLGWLWILLGLPPELGSMPVDLWVPDASFLLSALTFPHLPLAQGLMLGVVVFTLNFLEEGGWKSGVIAAGLGLLVSLIHPYTLVISNAVFVAYLLGRRLREKKPLWPDLGKVGLVSLPSLPYLLYVWSVFETNFAFQSWRAQSSTWSPQPLYYILGFGLILPLAGLGLWRGQKFSTSNRFSLLLVWLCIIPILLYVPTTLQRRFLDGYQAALAIPAAMGLAWLVQGPGRERWSGPATVIILILMSLSNLFLLAGSILAVQHRAAPVFHSGSQQAAFRWLAEHAPGQIILTTYRTGNVLPAYAPVKVFLGHGPETAEWTEKRKLVETFFGTDDETFQRRLLQEYNISYLFYGPAERALGDFAPAEVTYLEKVYDDGAIQIYRVKWGE